MRCERLKNVDQFGIPVSMTYKGEFTFNTRCGGCATIFIIMILISQLSLTILDFFLNHNLSQSTSLEYFDHPGNTNEKWSLNTADETLVGALKVAIPFRDAPEMQDIDIDQYFRIQFYQLEMTNGTEFKVDWVNAAKCKKMNYDLEGPLITSEEEENYVCPNVTSIDLLNYPPLYQLGNGTSFYMVVNNCTQAKQIEDTYGLTPYNDNVECAPAEDILAMTSKLSLQSKLMSQAAQDPQSFYDDLQPSSYFTQLVYTNLNPEFGQVYRSSVIKQRVNFYQYNFITWYEHLPIINFFTRLTIIFK